MKQEQRDEMSLLLEEQCSQRYLEMDKKKTREEKYF